MIDAGAREWKDLRAKQKQKVVYVSDSCDMADSKGQKISFLQEIDLTAFCAILGLLQSGKLELTEKINGSKEKVRRYC